MEKSKFTNLLTDLYNIYNPNGKEHIPELVELYSRYEFDSVKKIFIKYNHRRQSFYDPKVGGDDYVIQLVKDYGNGERPFQNYKLITTEDKRLEELKKREEQSTEKFTGFKSELAGEVEEQVTKMKEFLLKTEKEVAKKVGAIHELMSSDTDFDIKILLQETDEELDLQDKEKLVGLGIGARLVMKNKEENIFGLEITDILCDFVSNEKPTIELTVVKI